MNNSEIWVDNSDYGDWMVEFIPCKKGQNFSRDNLLDLISCWNKKIDEEAYEILMAVILEPEEKSEEYDFLWQQELWTKDRDIFWTEWRNNHENNWNEDFGSIATFLTYEIFDFKAYLRGELKPLDESNYHQEFKYCSLKKDHNLSEVLDFENNYQNLISTNKIKGSTLTAFLKPLSDHKLNNFDLIWHSCYEDLDALNESSKIIDIGLSSLFDIHSSQHIGKRIR